MIKYKQNKISSIQNLMIKENEEEEEINKKETKMTLHE